MAPHFSRTDRFSLGQVLPYRRVLARLNTPYNRVVVIARGRARHLEVDGATYASYHPVRRFFGYAWDAMAAVPLRHPGAADGGAGLRVLLIGVAGGTVLHALRVLLPRALVVAAEIDGDLMDLSRRHFALDETGAELRVADGYALLDAEPGGFDVVLDDAFLSHGETARTVAVSEQLVARLRRGLRRGGLLACNVFSDQDNAAARLAARQVFRRAFAEVFELEPPKGANAILCGGEGLREVASLAAHLDGLPAAARSAMRRLRGWPAGALQPGSAR